MSSRSPQTLAPTGLSGIAQSANVARIFQNYSLEITSKDREHLLAASRLIPTNTHVSITFLPGDSLDALADTAVYVRRLGFIPVPHIAARRIASAVELGHFLTALRTKAAIDRVFLIAGDLPHPLGPFADSRDVLQTGLLARHGVKTIGIAGYPDGHSRVELPVLWQTLHDKCELIQKQGLTAEIVTQFSFDARAVSCWIREVHSRNVRADIRVGVPGPTTSRVLLKYAAQCGVGASRSMLAKYGISLSRLFTSTTADGFLNDLVPSLSDCERSVRVHIYPFGALERAAAWVCERATSVEDKR